MEDTPKIPDTPHWKCNGCGYTFQAKVPPDKCAACNEECGYVDVTSYTPEGGFRGTDGRL